MTDRRIERLSLGENRRDDFATSQPMDEARWIKSSWGLSDNNRRARYYEITKAGRRRLAQLEQDWARHVAAVTRVIKLA